MPIDLGTPDYSITKQWNSRLVTPINPGVLLNCDSCKIKSVSERSTNATIEDLFGSGGRQVEKWKQLMFTSCFLTWSTTDTTS